MVIERTEEQQVEALKKWLTENGTMVLLGLVVGLSGVSGWKYWQHYEREQAELASGLYDTVFEYSEGMQGGSDAKEGDVKLTKIAELVDELQNEFSSSNYAVLASWIEAKHLVSSGQYSEAESVLTWVVNNTADGFYRQQAILRLARVQHALENTDSALKTLDQIDEDTASASYSELKGDLFISKGDRDKARDMYEIALSKAKSKAKGGVGNNEILEMKLNELSESVKVDHQSVQSSNLDNVEEQS